MAYSHSIICFECENRVYVKKVAKRNDGGIEEGVYEGICSECDQKYLLALRNETDEYYMFYVLHPTGYEDRGRLDIKEEVFSLF